MSITRSAALGATAAMLLACNRSDSSNGSTGLASKEGALGSAVAGTTGDAQPDPCALLSANEAAARGEELCDGGDGSANGGLREGEGADGRDLLEAVMEGRELVRVDLALARLAP